VSEISSHHAVHRVVSLGTIMALELRASSADGGYVDLCLNKPLTHHSMLVQITGNYAGSNAMLITS
jgi:hypothetical protein